MKTLLAAMLQRLALWPAGYTLSRTLQATGHPSPGSFPANVVRTQKHHPVLFLPIVLLQQFSFFANMYFLLVALSQLVPQLKLGFLFTYFAPLAFVLSITIGKEAVDDFKRYLRDKEANSKTYLCLLPTGQVERLPSCELKVGHLIFVHQNMRVPADLVLLRTSDPSGQLFIRTDQLDGESDWKLRKALSVTQKLAHDPDVLHRGIELFVEEPHRDIYSFVGSVTAPDESGQAQVEPVAVENVLWADTVVAGSTILGVVVYTGTQTRSVMNTRKPQTKVGLLDLEVNELAKVLAALLLLLSFLMVGIHGLHGQWYILLVRFMLLFSAIIPISLRVNLDMAKTLYAYFISHDKAIPGTIVRCSDIPEELGRIDYLFCDKTGTLTRNHMVFKKLHVGPVAFSDDTLDELSSYVLSAYATQDNTPSGESSKLSRKKIRRTVTSLTYEAVLACAVCHNVTPIYDTSSSTCNLAVPHEPSRVEYQASSPDEVSLVQMAEAVGLRLVDRSDTAIKLVTPSGEQHVFDILLVFPFSSELKRMGVIVKDGRSGDIVFYMKGADVVMSPRVQANDWLEEECGNLARSGLRTLVFGRRVLTPAEFDEFHSRYQAAAASVVARTEKTREVLATLEQGLELLCVTGVEDRLQDGVKTTLESIRNSGIRVWMITGDKVETATCIAVSSRLLSRERPIISLTNLKEADLMHWLGVISRTGDCSLVIDGHSLQLFLHHCPREFIARALALQACVCCRCSPTQKAAIVEAVNSFTQGKKRTCAIGDGGNDVSMIQTAHVGVGLAGKEGNHASLAADFSLVQFSHLAHLLLWHGRNSYKRSARLALFVIHRGVIISLIQACYSLIFYVAPIAIYDGWLLVGYATVYTMGPVFSLVLDEDVTMEIALQYPELYRDVRKGRTLSYKTFLIWMLKSVYQAGAIFLVTLCLFQTELIHITAITFSALVVCELVNVCAEIRRWHTLMAASILTSLGLYMLSLLLLHVFDLHLILSPAFWGRVCVVTLFSSVPLYAAKWVKRKYDPPSYIKLY